VTRLCIVSYFCACLFLHDNLAGGDCGKRAILLFILSVPGMRIWEMNVAFLRGTRSHIIQLVLFHACTIRWIFVGSNEVFCLGNVKDIFSQL